MDKDVKLVESQKENSLLRSIKNYISKMPSKLKIKIFICIAAVSVLFVLYNNFVKTSEKENFVTTTTNQYSYYVSSIDYCAKVEEKLKRVLSNLDSIGSVEVMVTLDSSMELVFAESNKSDSSNSIFDSAIKDEVDNVSSPIIIDTNGKEEPLIIKEVLPRIKGVLVVCSGTNNISTKLDIMHAVQSLLGIDLNNIQVLFNS